MVLLVIVKAPLELFAIPPPGPSEVLPEIVLSMIVIGPLELFKIPPPPGASSVAVLQDTVVSVIVMDTALWLLMQPPICAELQLIALTVMVMLPVELVL